MLRLYFIRHGETEWNVENRLQGSLDSPLTEGGKEAVRKLKEETDYIKWKAIYSSPSERAVETASRLVDINRVVIDERLKEMNLHMFEGLTWDEVKLMDEQQYYYYWQDPEKFSIPFAETFHDVEQRVRQFLTELRAIHPDGNVMIVTHGVVIKIAETIINNKKLASLWDTAHVRGATFTVFNLAPYL